MSGAPFVDFQTFLKDTVKKSEIQVTSTSKIQYPTGFMYLDAGNGSYLTVRDENDIPIYQYHNVGITRGSVIVVISKSQGGKTTLCLKMASSIIEPYINPYIYERMTRFTDLPKAPENSGTPFIQILDTEKTLPTDYVRKVAAYTNKMVQKHVVINPITTDRDLIRCLEQHVKYKVSTMKKVPMPMLDMFGNPIMEYPPTVMIVDSTSQLLLEDCDDPEEIKKSSKGISDIYADSTQNTSGARRAKIISALYSQMVNYADRYNIIIFSINHINKMLPVNGIPVKQYRGLRAGETIGGGEKAIFLASSILRLDVIKNVSPIGSTSVNLGDTITGHVAIASWIKSKSNSKMNTSQLVYTSDNGYDPLLSNLWMAKENHILGESGRFLFIPGYEDLKFTMKTYPEVFAANPKLLRALYFLVQKDYEKLLDDPDRADRKNRELLESIRKDIRKEAASGEYSRHDADDMDDMFAALIND